MPFRYLAWKPKFAWIYLIYKLLNLLAIRFSSSALVFFFRIVSVVFCWSSNFLFCVLGAREVENRYHREIWSCNVVSKFQRRSFENIQKRIWFFSVLRFLFRFWTFSNNFCQKVRTRFWTFRKRLVGTCSVFKVLYSVFCLDMFMPSKQLHLMLRNSGITILRLAHTEVLSFRPGFYKLKNCLTPTNVKLDSRNSYLSRHFISNFWRPPSKTTSPIF